MKKKKTAGINDLLDDLKSTSLIGLDSMIFLYFFEEEEPWSLLSRAIVEKVEKGDFTAVTSFVTVLEVISLPELEQDKERLKFFIQFYKHFPNLIVDLASDDVLYSAARIRRLYGLKTPDALQLATAVNRKADIFITNDKEYSKAKDEIRIILLDDYL